MGILARMLRLCKADVHGVMDQMEDKGLLLKQYLREMEAGLKEKEAQLSQISHNCRQAESELSLRREEINKLEQDLDLAVRREKDDIARALIRKRRSLQGNCDQLAYHIEGLNEEIKYLAESLQRQHLQYDQMKIKVASFGRLAAESESNAAFAGADAQTHWYAPTQEEVELELLQRKEAIQQGGAS